MRIIRSFIGNCDIFISLREPHYFDYFMEELLLVDFLAWLRNYFSPAITGGLISRLQDIRLLPNYLARRLVKNCHLLPQMLMVLDVVLVLGNGLCHFIRKLSSFGSLI